MEKTAYDDTIQKAAVKLSYAFNFENEKERMKMADYWKKKLKIIIIKEGFSIIE